MCQPLPHSIVTDGEILAWPRQGGVSAQENPTGYSAMQMHEMLIRVVSGEAKRGASMQRDITQPQKGLRL